MMKKIVVLFLPIILSFSLIYGEEAINQDYLGNRGFIYSNPDIPEKKPKIKETKPLIIEIVPVKPPKPKTPTKPKKSIEEIKIIKKMLPESYYESELETRVEEKEVLLEKEIISLRRRLKEATNQLILANQKIKELKEKTYKPYTTQTYIVQKGDCLWSIAGRKEIYGDPYKWLLLYHANKDQIRNPNLIFPNMVIIIPRLEEYERKK